MNPFAALGRAAIAAALGVAAVGAAASTTREWRFTALLDGEPIGYHRFVVEQQGPETRVTSEARFNVRFLFFDVYRYRHDNREVWRGDCLARIDSSTDDNGELAFVRGAQEQAGFRVATANGTATLPACVRTFAYWNPRILESDRLLNAQTGEYAEIEVLPLGPSTVRVGGEPTPAHKFRLQAPDFAIDLWYSNAHRWLALESITAEGRRLRYRLD